MDILTQEGWLIPFLFLLMLGLSPPFLLCCFRLGMAFTYPFSFGVAMDKMEHISWCICI